MHARHKSTGRPRGRPRTKDSAIAWLRGVLSTRDMSTDELRKMVRAHVATLGFGWSTVVKVKTINGIGSYRNHTGLCTGAWFWTLKSAVEIDALHEQQESEIKEAEIRKIRAASDDRLEAMLDDAAYYDKFGPVIIVEMERRNAEDKLKAEQAEQAKQAAKVVAEAADAAAKAAEEVGEAALPPLWEDPDRERAIIVEAMRHGGTGIGTEAGKMTKRFPNWKEIPAAVECMNRLREARNAATAKDEAQYKAKLKQVTI